MSLLHKTSLAVKVAVSYSLMRSATGKTDGSHRSKLIKGFIDKRTRLNKLNFALGVVLGSRFAIWKYSLCVAMWRERKVSLWGHTFKTLAGKGVWLKWKVAHHALTARLPRGDSSLQLIAVGIEFRHAAADASWESTALTLPLRPATFPPC